MVRKGKKKSASKTHGSQTPEQLQLEAATLLHSPTSQSKASSTHQLPSGSLLQQLATGMSSPVTDVITEIIEMVMVKNNNIGADIPMQHKIASAASEIMGFYKALEMHNSPDFFPEFQPEVVSTPSLNKNQPSTSKSFEDIKKLPLLPEFSITEDKNTKSLKITNTKDSLISPKCPTNISTRIRNVENNLTETSTGIISSISTNKTSKDCTDGTKTFLQSISASDVLSKTPAKNIFEQPNNNLITDEETNTLHENADFFETENGASSEESKKKRPKRRKKINMAARLGLTEILMRGEINLEPEEAEPVNTEQNAEIKTNTNDVKAGCASIGTLASLTGDQPNKAANMQTVLNEVGITGKVDNLEITKKPNAIKDGKAQKTFSEAVLMKDPLEPFQPSGKPEIMNKTSEDCTKGTKILTKDTSESPKIDFTNTAPEVLSKILPENISEQTKSNLLVSTGSDILPKENHTSNEKADSVKVQSDSSTKESKKKQPKRRKINMAARLGLTDILRKGEINMESKEVERVGTEPNPETIINTKDMKVEGAPIGTLASLTEDQPNKAVNIQTDSNEVAGKIDNSGITKKRNNIKDVKAPKNSNKAAVKSLLERLQQAVSETTDETSEDYINAIFVKSPSESFKKVGMSETDNKADNSEEYKAHGDSTKPISINRPTEPSKEIGNLETANKGNTTKDNTEGESTKGVSMKSFLKPLERVNKSEITNKSDSIRSDKAEEDHDKVVSVQLLSEPLKKNDKAENTNNIILLIKAHSSSPKHGDLKDHLDNEQQHSFRNSSPIGSGMSPLVKSKTDLLTPTTVEERSKYTSSMKTYSGRKKHQKTGSSAERAKCFSVEVTEKSLVIITTDDLKERDSGDSHEADRKPWTGISSEKNKSEMENQTFNVRDVNSKRLSFSHTTDKAEEMTKKQTPKFYKQRGKRSKPSAGDWKLIRSELNRTTKNRNGDISQPGVAEIESERPKLPAEKETEKLLLIKVTDKADKTVHNQTADIRTQYARTKQSIDTQSATELSYLNSTGDRNEEIIKDQTSINASKSSKAKKCNQLTTAQVGVPAEISKCFVSYPKEAYPIMITDKKGTKTKLTQNTKGQESPILVEQSNDPKHNVKYKKSEKNKSTDKSGRLIEVNDKLMANDKLRRTNKNKEKDISSIKIPENEVSKLSQKDTSRSTGWKKAKSYVVYKSKSLPPIKTDDETKGTSTEMTNIQGQSAVRTPKTRFFNQPTITNYTPQKKSSRVEEFTKELLIKSTNTIKCIEKAIVDSNKVVEYKKSNFCEQEKKQITMELTENATTIDKEKCSDALSMINIKAEPNLEAGSINRRKEKQKQNFSAEEKCYDVIFSKTANELKYVAENRTSGEIDQGVIVLEESKKEKSSTIGNSKKPSTMNAIDKAKEINKTKGVKRRKCARTVQQNAKQSATEQIKSMETEDLQEAPSSLTIDEIIQITEDHTSGVTDNSMRVHARTETNSKSSITEKNKSSTKELDQAPLSIADDEIRQITKADISKEDDTFDVVDQGEPSKTKEIIKSTDVKKKEHAHIEQENSKSFARKAIKSTAKEEPEEVPFSITDDAIRQITKGDISNVLDQGVTVIGKPKTVRSTANEEIAGKKIHPLTTIMQEKPFDLKQTGDIKYNTPNYSKEMNKMCHCNKENQFPKIHIPPSDVIRNKLSGGSKILITKNHLNNKLQLDVFTADPHNVYAVNPLQSTPEKIKERSHLSQQGQPILNSTVPLQLNSDDKNPLMSAWTLWFYEKKTGNWFDHLKEVATFDTGLDFWMLFNHIKLPGDLPIGWDCCIFRTGIKPIWEDDRNRNGGKWVVCFDSSKRKEELTRRWIDTIFFMLSEVTLGYTSVCGAVLSIRAPEDKIALWTENAMHTQVNINIGKDFKTMLQIDQDTKCAYYAHADTTCIPRKYIYRVR